MNVLHLQRGGGNFPLFFTRGPPGNDREHAGEEKSLEKKKDEVRYIMKKKVSVVARLAGCRQRIRGGTFRQRIRGGTFRLLVPVLALLCLGVTTQVFAATHRAPAGPQMSLGPLCSGHGCDDRDPYATRCAGQSWDQVWVVLSASIKNQRGQQIGYTQLWWSQTCQTNWARVVALVPPRFIRSSLDVQWGGYEYTLGATQSALITSQYYAPVALASARGEIDQTDTLWGTACANQEPPELCN
jgi:hypothetical protein